MQKNTKVFLLRNKENPDLNQYWYSDKTIKFLANQAKLSEKSCFLSTPSVFYALGKPQGKQQFHVFDLDEKFGKNNECFFAYDFNHPEKIPEKYHNYFDFVLADPPFITEIVWRKYAEAIGKIIKKDNEGKWIGRVLLSTIDENQKFLNEILGVKKRKFKPSIPKLVYQYSLYSNYDHEDLDNANQEIPE